MTSYTFISKSPNETHAFSKRLAGYLFPGTVITLEGDLGAGKTTFTKGLAEGLGITRTVNSPTFTIIKEYEGRLKLYHMDVYRVEDEFEELGFDEYFSSDGVSVVEWAHLIEGQLPDQRLDIQLYHAENQARRLELKPVGRKYEQICEVFFHENPID
ncbi:tRNA (adenosine(37)-N6)-threonylcarbamoyltransferase complex ATPase subunit type 1 TsaE [Bacillus massilinigeriensis]|uniref:tRNA (adenosine(37)-N6)-threonylcarbamoyltransferase complex ATPase subunit type 1 TsaE n=1 Tax=Bacillus mediterraneensis TaxID=1805474 RepID=UPI0008F91F46|nr:tRNA (adenosine(37)-N6)-threonylcarbamoyltransferase complex ATPase subunit type 1 TsaE [Bacillus mediterraneensis]